MWNNNLHKNQVKFKAILILNITILQFVKCTINIQNISEHW